MITRPIAVWCLLAPTWWTDSKTALEPINRHRSLGDLQSTWLRMFIFLGYFVCCCFFSPSFFPLWESIISRAKCGENVGKPEIKIASSSALNDFWVIRTTEFSKRSFIYIIMPRPVHFHRINRSPKGFFSFSCNPRLCAMISIFECTRFHSPSLSFFFTFFTWLRFASGHFSKVLIWFDWLELDLAGHVCVPLES